VYARCILSSLVYKNDTGYRFTIFVSVRQLVLGELVDRPRSRNDPVRDSGNVSRAATSIK
jgi:hypothetical protein